MDLKKIFEMYDNIDYIRLLNQTPVEQKEECFSLILKRGDCHDLNNCIAVLPENLKLKYVGLYDFNQYNAYVAIINGVVSEEIRFQLLSYALKATKNTWEIEFMFHEVPMQYKEQFLNLIAEKEKTIQNEIIASYNLSDYLQDFDIEKRVFIIKNILFQKFNYNYYRKKNNRIDEYWYDYILKVVKEEGISLKESKMYDILLFLLDERKQSLEKESIEHYKILNLEPILKVFIQNGYDAKEIIKVIIDKDIADIFTISQSNRYLPEEQKKEFTIFVIDYCNSQGKIINISKFYSAIRNLNMNDRIELFDKYVVKENFYDYQYILAETDDCLFYANQLFVLMTPEQIDENFDSIATAISLNQREFDFSSGYEKLVKVYADKYNVNYYGLYKFIEKFGFTTLKYLSNEKIRQYINLPEDKLGKLLNIFNDNNYYFDKSIKNDIINSLYQREFMVKQKDVYNIFNTFERMIAKGDNEGVMNLIAVIGVNYDITKILTKNQISFEEFFTKTMKGDLDILHQITDRFIAIKREEYIKEKLVNVDENLIMDLIISRESYKKDMVINHSYWITSYLTDDNKHLFNNEQLNLLENRDVLDEIITFKQNPKEYHLNPEYKKHLKVFGDILDILYDNKHGFSLYYPNDNSGSLQFDYVQKEVTNNYLLGILLESNYDGISNIIDDEQLYLKLLQFLDKYKMLGWQHTFNNILTSCEMDYTEGTVAGLLSNFDKIVDKIEAQTTLTGIIDYANCYASTSKRYSLLFGREDFNFIAANSGKNRATMSKYDRLRNNMNLINAMYKRKYVTTPTINETIPLENGKSIDVILGNSTNMMNLTYGERTDACMRQGGAFDDLFHYCIENENGFHIRLSDPKTGKFVSRVSGLRRGNTIFLNELRHSVTEDYTDEDLYIAIKNVAEHLVSISQNSSAPIDNVIVTTDYALEFKEEETQDLNLTYEQLTQVLNGISFNLSGSGDLVLATSNHGTLVEYNFDMPLPRYNVKRDIVKIYKGQSAKERMLQLMLINQVLNGGNIEDIDIDVVIDMPDYLVSGEDFYIAYKNGETSIFVLDRSKGNEKTQEEIEGVLNSGYMLEEQRRKNI